MQYRRLGRTGWMVSEVGLDAAALVGVEPVVSGATVQAALAAGVTLITFEARDDAGDAEVVVGQVAGSDRPRLTMIARFARLPEGDAIGPEIAAAGSRIAVDGYVDVATFPALPDRAALAAFDALRTAGAIRAWGIEVAAAEARDVELVTAVAAGGGSVVLAPLDAPMLGAVLDAARQHDLGVVLLGPRVEAREEGPMLPDPLRAVTAAELARAAVCAITLGVGSPGAAQRVAAFVDGAAIGA